MELIKQIDETVSFNEKNIRVIGSYNEPWFVAKDICNILELKNITETMKMIPEKWRSSEKLNTFGGEQNMIIINEAGLYKLIMRSNKPIAQKFQEVVCEEILPSLRKKGEYKIQSIIDKNKELEEEKKKIIDKYEKTKKREIEKGYIIYVGMNDLDPKVFKVGTTVNLSSRTSSLSTGTSEDFVAKKTWFCRYYKQIESTIKIRFDKYRTLARKELYDIEKYDEICAFINKIVSFYNENDQEYFDKLKNEKMELKKEEEKKINKDLEFMKNQPPNLIFIDNNRSEKKKCSKCLLGKSLSEFYIRDGNIKQENFNLSNEEENEEYKTKKYRSHCKQCCNEEGKKHRINIKETQNYNRKECIDCKTILTYDNFYKIEEGKLYENCIECFNKDNNLINSKQCNECNLILNTENFGIHTGNLLRNQCKECRNKKIKESRPKNEKVGCEFCNKQIKHKNNLSAHQKTKACLKIQESSKFIS